MANSRLDPLAYNVPIADKDGNPTPEFMRKWAQQFGINGTIPVASGTGLFVQTGSGAWVLRLIDAGTGISVTNGNGVAGNPSIALTNTAVTPGAYGDATHVATFTVDQQGRLTAAAAVLITSSGGGAMLPLVNGDLPGPALVADPSGQCIGVPL